LEEDLTPAEKEQFAKTHTYVRGAKAGKTTKTGIIYREDERFFLWSDKSEKSEKHEESGEEKIHVG
jgi:hypothetical protein